MREFDAEPSDVPRYTREVMPPYTYVPGQQPHPIRDPDGHRYGQPEPSVDHFDPTKWAECTPYLFGVDLFNAGFYWESHEQWEAVWLAVGRRGTTADLLKGLIKFSAAGVKHLEGRPVGVARHARRAADLLEAVLRATQESRGIMLGLAVEPLRDRAVEMAAHGWQPFVVTLQS